MSEPTPKAVPESPGTDDENEVLRETRAMKAQAAAAAAASSEQARADTEKAAGEGGMAKHGLGWKAAAGIGIGSAALLAAVLYAKRQKDD